METVVDFLPSLLAHDLHDSLKALDGIPGYIVCGEDDVMTPVSHTRKLMELLPDARGVILPTRGHDPTRSPGRGHRWYPATRLRQSWA